MDTGPLKLLFLLLNIYINLLMLNKGIFVQFASFFIIISIELHPILLSAFFET